MNTQISNEFYDASISGEVAVLKIKEKVFEFIVDIQLSDKLLEFFDIIDHNPKIKALVYYNDPNSLTNEQYDSFINRILAKDTKNDENEAPGFCERNTRFREINVLNKLIRKIAELQKLVICGIQGTVVTPFIGAALVADFRYATEDAVLSMIHNRYGLHPSGGLPILLGQFMNHSKVMEVQLSEKINGKEALKLGLINKLFPGDHFLETMLTEIKKYTQTNYCTIRDTKRLTSFSRKALSEYFEFEAAFLNL